LIRGINEIKCLKNFLSTRDESNAINRIAENLTLNTASQTFENIALQKNLCSNVFSIQFLAFRGLFSRFSAFLVSGNDGV
jgi:Ulp1 family protease